LVKTREEGGAVFIFPCAGFPASGKAAEYRAATEEWVKKAHAQGCIVSLARQYFGADVLGLMQQIGVAPAIG
jgi:hypothetical protein